MNRGGLGSFEPEQRDATLTYDQQQRRRLVSVHRSPGHTGVDALVSAAHVEDLKEAVLHKIPAGRGRGRNIHEKENKQTKEAFQLTILPWVLSDISGYLCTILLPEDLKVVAEGLVELRQAGELSRGPFQDPRVLGRLHYSGGIFRTYGAIRNIPTPGSSNNRWEEKKNKNSLPLTESITLMADEPSVFLAKHVYGPVSSFSAL